MNTRKITLAALAASLAVAMAAPAVYAAQHKPPHKAPHERAMGMMPEMAFVRLLKVADTDKDGKITKAEFETYRDGLFTRIDADKDGSVTPKEFRDYSTIQFEEFRKNNPPGGGMTDEADAPDAAKPDDAKRDDKRHAKAQGKARADMKRENAMFRMADADGNGQIGKQEFVAAGDKIFTRIDRNSDNTVSIDDMPDRPM